MNLVKIALPSTNTYSSRTMIGCARHIMKRNCPVIYCPNFVLPTNFDTAGRIFHISKNVFTLSTLIDAASYLDHSASLTIIIIYLESSGCAMSMDRPTALSGSYLTIDPYLLCFFFRSLDFRHSLCKFFLGLAVKK